MAQLLISETNSEVTDAARAGLTSHSFGFTAKTGSSRFALVVSCLVSTIRTESIRKGSKILFPIVLSRGSFAGDEHASTSDVKEIRTNHRIGRERI
jgi:hypothetical protein